MSYPTIKLCYQLAGKRAEDAERIKEASSQKYEIHDFSITREGEELQAVTDRYPDVDSARAKLEPWLRAWEREADLYQGLRFRFDISSSQTVTGTVDSPEVGVTIFAPTARMTVKAHLLRAEFPGLPTLTQDTERAQIMVNKLHELEDGAGRLCAVAYSIFTEIKASCGGKIEVASKRYGISQGVLETLGRLSSQNAPIIGRKVKGPEKPLTSEEREWVRQFAEKVGHRLVEIEYGRNLDELSQITMDDGPKLQ